MQIFLHNLQKKVGKFSHQSSDRYTLLRLSGQHVIQNLYSSACQSEIFAVLLNLEQRTVLLSLLSFWTHRVCWVFERHKTLISNWFKLLGEKRTNENASKTERNLRFTSMTSILVKQSTIVRT